MGASLEAIRYKREGDHASLNLLEQRKLPLETEWLEISGPRAAWTAIRDMTVRGAPAIGELLLPLLLPLPLAPASMHHAFCFIQDIESAALLDRCTE